MIGNGTNNVAQGMYSFVGNGGGVTAPVPLNNRALADFSFIGSGEELLVDANAHFSAIVSGQTNTVSAAYMHSVIAGGVGNTINGSCSAILGGSGNTVNHDWAAVFGNGISTAATNTFHVECLNALNTPDMTAGTYPSGTVVYLTCGATIPAGARALYIIP